MPATCSAAAPPSTLLVADIGGTNARYQLWRASLGEPAALLHERTLQTSAHASFEDSLAAFLAGQPQPSAACLAVAGPVSDNRARLTNLGWTVDAAPLRAAWSTPAVRVVNDFEAVGYAVLRLQEGEARTLHEAPALPRAPVAVLGPGTGLGQALLTWDSGIEGYTVTPSEGAHADFAPVGPLQRQLAAWVEETTGECEVEQVCCGAGIARIYEFLRTCRADAAAAGLSPAQVTDAALAGSCPVATEAVSLFLSILGAEAANLGLKALARGGVYLAGGIPPRLLPLLDRGDTALQQAFLRPACRFGPVRASMPLRLVTGKEPGLSGALFVAQRELAAALH